MWVYQETKTNAAALVPTLPEDTAGESLAEKEAMTPVSEPLAELPPQKAPRRKPSRPAGTASCLRQPISSVR